MKAVVCDASPLIILAKLDQLHLIGDLLGTNIIVLQCVADEVLGDRATATERQRLSRFLSNSTTVIDYSEIEVEAKSLSRSDRHTLTYCVRNAVDWLVADERLMRRVASEHGIPVVGVLGLIAGFAKRGIFSRVEAESALRAAVSDHGLRISVALYQRVMDALKDS